MRFPLTNILLVIKPFKSLVSITLLDLNLKNLHSKKTIIIMIDFTEGYCWSKTSERQVLKIRHKYLEAVLRQEVGFFDSQEATTADVVNSISKDTSLLQEVLSEKVPRL